jgi:nitrous oxidase accessory protein NosD
MNPWKSRQFTRRLLSGAFLVLGAVLLSAGLTAGARAATVTVDCSTGDKLQTAVDAARPGDTILVRGVCAENIIVPDEAARITLDGQGSATVDGPNPANATIMVLGRGITIRGFTITGGSAGVQLFRGGVAIIDRNTIQDTKQVPGMEGGQGIHVAQHSYAVIIGNTIQRNPFVGIMVQESSSARIGVQNPNDATPREM